MLLQTWAEVLIFSFQQLWLGIVGFIPKLLLAIIIFCIGWVIAVTLDKIVSRLIRILKVDSALRGLGVEKFLERGGLRLDSGAFIGALVKWFFIVVFLIASLEVLGLNQVNYFLRDVILTYLPNVIVAAFILVVAAVIAGIAQRGVVGAARGAGVPSATLLGGMAKWAIWVFAIMAALYQLGIAAPFIQTLFTGLVAMMVIAGGLAFGLGGKEAAARYLEKLKQDISGQ
jgi:hypothetical protein